MVCGIDFNHYEKEHTPQTGHNFLKAGLAKGDPEFDTQ